MTDSKEQPRDLTGDLELGAQYAAKAVGGDVNGAATQRPAEYLVFKLDTIMTTAPPVAP